MRSQDRIKKISAVDGEPFHPPASIRPRAASKPERMDTQKGKVLYVGGVYRDVRHLQVRALTTMRLGVECHVLSCKLWLSPVSVQPAQRWVAYLQTPRPLTP